MNLTGVVTAITVCILSRWSQVQVLYEAIVSLAQSVEHRYNPTTPQNKSAAMAELV